MSRKSKQYRSSLSFDVEDGVLDMDHIMEANPWKEAENFNKSEMSRIGDVLNDFNNMVLNRKRSLTKRDGKHKEKNEEAAGKKTERVSSKRTVHGTGGRKVTGEKRNCAQPEDADTVRVSAQTSRIPRPKKTIGASMKKSDERKKQDTGKGENGANEATKASNGRSTSERPVKIGRKKNIQTDKRTGDAKKEGKKAVKQPSSRTVPAQGKEKTSRNFRELPKRNDSQELDEMSKRAERDRPQNHSSVENKTRRVSKQKSSVVSEEKKMNIKQERISVVEKNNCDMTFDAARLDNSTMSGHVPVNTTATTITSTNTTSHSRVRKSANERSDVKETAALPTSTPSKPVQQIKQQIESPIPKSTDTVTRSSETPKKNKKLKASAAKTAVKAEKRSPETPKKIFEDKPRAKTPCGRCDQSGRKGGAKEKEVKEKRVRRHGRQAARAMEKFSHHVQSIVKEMGYLKDIDSSDSDSSCSDCSACSSYSHSSYSTHSDFCTCGDCTSCSSDEYSEYTICSCSGCNMSSFSDST